MPVPAGSPQWRDHHDLSRELATAVDEAESDEATSVIVFRSADPVAVTIAKQCVLNSLTMSQDDALDQEFLLYAETLNDPASRKHMTAFLSEPGRTDTGGRPQGRGVGSVSLVCELVNRFAGSRSAAEL